MGYWGAWDVRYKIQGVRCRISARHRTTDILYLTSYIIDEGLINGDIRYRESDVGPQVLRHRTTNILYLASYISTFPSDRLDPRVLLAPN